MPQAWQAREHQRLCFVERLADLIHEKNETVPGKSFLFDTGVAIMLQLAYLREETEVPTVRSEAGSFFLKTISPQVGVFARVPEEAAVLLTRLLETIQKSACTPFAMALRHKELDSPQSVYGAPSATSEVPLEGVS